MTQVAKSPQDGLPPVDSQNWEAIERSLAIATKAESLREQSRSLRETSRLIREESARIGHQTRQDLHDPLAMVFIESR